MLELERRESFTLAPDVRSARDEGLLRAVAVVGLCTVVSALMEPYLDQANLILVYMAGVAYVALHSGQPASIWTVLASIAIFDWIFVAPRWSFKPTDPQYYFTFIVMLAVGVLIGHLAERTRMHAALATAREHRAQTLNRLASRLTSARSEAAIAQAVATGLRECMDVPAEIVGLPGTQVSSTAGGDGTLHLPLQSASGPPGRQVPGLCGWSGAGTGAGRRHRVDRRRRERHRVQAWRIAKHWA